MWYFKFSAIWSHTLLCWERMATFCLVIECPLLFLQFRSFLKSYIPYISSLMFLQKKKKKNSKQYIWCFASLDFINTALFSLHFDWKIRINKKQYPTIGCTLLIQVQCISSFRCSLRQYYKTIRFKIFFKRWEKWIRRLAATEKIIKSWRQFQRGSLLYNYN